MPMRTNEFQQLVAYVYSKIGPIGGKVTESAELFEEGSTTKREIDILIEVKVSGIELKIAIECRDRSRDETVEWVDALIGKYSRLRVNKVVAVSSSGFSGEAERKAAAHNIDTITAEEAARVDWAARVAAEFFTVMTHSFMLLWIGAFSKDGAEISSSKIDPDNPEIKPENIQHNNSISEKLFPVFYAYFVQHVRDKADREMTAKIAENWRHYILHPTPRYCEYHVNDMHGEIDLDGTVIHLDRLVFGCGAKFHLKRADVNNLVVADHMLSRFTVGAIAEKEFQVSIITSRDQGVVSVEIHDRPLPRSASDKTG
jgi:hypothetical protein